MSTLSLRLATGFALALISMMAISKSNAHELSLSLQALLERSGRDNLIELVQQGNANNGYVIQAGRDNDAYITQQGELNQVFVAQAGSDNEVKLLQSGGKNSASITQIGEANLVELNQTGSHSFSILQIADNAAISITQY